MTVSHKFIIATHESHSCIAGMPLRANPAGGQTVNFAGQLDVVGKLLHSRKVNFPIIWGCGISAPNENNLNLLIGLQYPQDLGLLQVSSNSCALNLCIHLF